MSIENSGDESKDSGIDIPDTTRRKLIAAGATTWATVTLAGCTGSSSNAASTTTAAPTTTAKPEPKHYVVTQELLVGSHGVIPKDAGMVSSCSPATTFMPGMQIVFHVGVYDPATGDPVGNDTIDSMSVELDNGNSVEMAWAGDAESHAEPIWKGNWVVPKEATAGTVNYSVKITDGDATYQDVNVAENAFSIITDFQPSNYVVTDNLVIGSGGDVPKDNAFASSCSTERTFAPGMQIVFHVGVYDPGTADPVGDKTISKMVVKLDTGDAVDMVWAGDAESHAEPIWKGNWVVPQDAELGAHTYTINVTAEDHTFTEVDVEENSFTLVKG